MRVGDHVAKEVQGPTLSQGVFGVDRTHFPQPVLVLSLV